MAQYSNVSMIIWANHLLRSSIKSMEECCKSIIENESISQIENSISQLQNIFNYVDMKELDELDQKYLPK